MDYHKLESGVEATIAELLKSYEANKRVPKAQFGTKEKLVQKLELEEEEENKEKQPASGEDFILYRKHTYLYANHAYHLKDIKMKDKVVEEFILINPHNNSLVKGGVEIIITPKELEEYFDRIIITK